ARRRRPVVQSGDESHAVHAQSTGRERLRRGRGDRGTGSIDERGDGCAGNLRRQASRHACVAASRVAGDSKRACARVIIMYTFEYQLPKTLADAAKALTSTGGKPLAGGQSLVAAMKLRLAQPGTLGDLRGISELAGIRKEGDALVIGA